MGKVVEIYSVMEIAQIRVTIVAVQAMCDRISMTTVVYRIKSTADHMKIQGF